eukprot:1427164-Rhodomonas_salina.2
MEARSRSKTPCNSGLVASRSPTEPMSRSAEEERELLDSAHREGADLDLATNGDVAKRLAGTVENKDRDEAEWSLAETDQLPSAKKEGCDDEVSSLCRPVISALSLTFSRPMHALTHPL